MVNCLYLSCDKTRFSLSMDLWFKTFISELNISMDTLREESNVVDYRGAAEELSFAV